MAGYSRVKINDFKVKKVIMPGALDQRPIKGSCLLPELHANVFIVARKKKGKSTIVVNIVKNCSTKDTKVIVFSATIGLDPIWKELFKWLEEHEIPYLKFQSMESKNGENLLEALVSLLQKKAKDEETDTPKPEFQDFKRKPPKYQSPEYLIILDDISSECRSKELSALSRVNRHIRSKLIISSQYLKDCLPGTLLQMNVWILLGGHNEATLKIVYDKARVWIPWPDFVKLYEDSTSDKYSFLMIDTDNQELRRNFDVRYKQKSSLPIS